MKLGEQHCVKIEKDEVRLSNESQNVYLHELNEWQIIEDGSKLTKTFNFNNFKEAIYFVNRVGAIAEAENHHPDIFLKDYKFVEIHLSTHDIGGLHKNDFILASKIDLIS